jgi:hypothetical protein
MINMGEGMLRSIFFVIVAGMVAITCSCGDRVSKSKEPIAVVNGYVITAEDFRVGMLGHEMGHCILDHYFAIQPPTKIAEMLCHYVDREISSGSDAGREITSENY